MNILRQDGLRTITTKSSILNPTLKQLKPPRNQSLKHTPRIKLPTNLLQMELARQTIPINNLLSPIRIVQVLIPTIQVSLLRFILNIGE